MPLSQLDLDVFHIPLTFDSRGGIDIPLPFTRTMVSNSLKTPTVASRL
jgi:hypothetical protein